MNRCIRAFFQKHHVLEVETPAASQCANTDPHIESFAFSTEGEMRYLHTSPEYPMKRLLASGLGDIYQIAKVWRAGEVGSRHNPEFTLLEWYRLDFSYHQLMSEVEALLLELLPSLENRSTKKSYQQVFLETLSINPHSAPDQVLMDCIKQQQLGVDFVLDRSSMLDLLMTHCIEPNFDEGCLTFIYDYPEQQSALACVRAGNLSVAERFEVYMGALELGNGYQELCDPAKNREVLQKENKMRRMQGKKIMPLDERFLSAMEQGMPSCSGVAIGLDRVLMSILNKKSIQDVISFPWRMA